MANIRCPHCGSPVRLRGSRWECGFCGDFGSISSLHPSEKAKLRSGIQLSAAVTHAPEAPGSFSRRELAEMVRRWDLDRNKWACRDLLIAAFPEAVGSRTAGELKAMDTQDLLDSVAEADPGTAITMARLLLDTAEAHLQDQAPAARLLGWDMGGLLRNPRVQEPLLRLLKTDRRLARQLFQSAWVGPGQQALLEACDEFAMPELKERLLALLEENPWFKGFH